MCSEWNVNRNSYLPKQTFFLFLPLLLRRHMPWVIGHTVFYFIPKLKWCCTTETLVSRRLKRDLTYVLVNYDLSCSCNLKNHTKKSTTINQTSREKITTWMKILNGIIWQVPNHIRGQCLRPYRHPQEWNRCVPLSSATRPSKFDRLGLP